MNLSFVKNSKIYSAAVEGLRKEGVQLTEANIKQRYEELDKETKGSKVKPTETVEETEDVVEEPVKEPKPKSKKK